MGIIRTEEQKCITNLIMLYIILFQEQVGQLSVQVVASDLELFIIF